MMSTHRVVVAGVCAVALVLGLGLGASAPAQLDANLVHIYPAAHLVGAVSTAPPTTAMCEAALHIACYRPGQVRTAYNLAPLAAQGINGRGQTIVIVDAFGSPTIAHDLQVFDSTFGLGAPPSFRVIQPAGAVPPYQPTGTRKGWAFETTLDVEWAHAIAPGANILLVETPVAETEGTTGFPQIVTAEKYVVDHHLGGVISQSFGATERTFPSRASLVALRGAYTDAAANGVTVLAASGDAGATNFQANGSSYYLTPALSWPASDPLVTAVGGTQLHLSATGTRTSADTAWNDTYNAATNRALFGNAGPNAMASGGGGSVVFSRPAYQSAVASLVGTHRGVPDISMSAACNGAVVTYMGPPGLPAGWYLACGTSEASPLFAGIVALAIQQAGHLLGSLNAALYALSQNNAAGVVDVTSGNNTVSFIQGGLRRTVTGFAARPGYDLATGIGTLNAASFVPSLVAASTSP
jgi:subtilase family serine protease